MDVLETIFNQLVTEARGDKKPPAGGVTVSDKPDDDENASVDYGADIPEDDAGGNNPPGDDGGGGITVSDQPAAGGDTQATGPEQGTDYGADMPTDDAGGDDAGGGGDQGGGITVSDQPDDGNADTGTDYGADAPTGDEGGDQPPDEGDVQGDAADAGGDNPPPEGGGDAGTEGDAPPEEGEEGADDGSVDGAEGTEDSGISEDGNADGVDESEEDSTTRKNAQNILLLRSFIRLHKEIRLIIKRISESRKRSLLATVTYKQVTRNLHELREIVYKYILLEYDGSTYSENLYHFNYFLEILEFNYQMLNKVKEVQNKAAKLLEKSSSRKQNKKSKKPTSS